MSETEKKPTTSEKSGEKKHSSGNLFFVKAGVTLFITVVCCILFFFVLYRFSGFKDLWSGVITAAQPIIIGLILAYLVNPVKKKTEKVFLKFFSKRMANEKKAKTLAKVLSVVVSILLLIAVIALLIAAVVPAVISSVSGLIKTLPDYVADFVKKIQEGELGDSALAKFATEQLVNLTDYIEEWAQTRLLPEAQTYISQITTGVISVVKSVLNFIIGIIVTVYVLMIEETLVGQSKKILFAVSKPKVANIIIEVLQKANEIFSGFISGKIIDSVIIGLICYIGCCIMHIPDAILVAVIVGVTNIIPVFGPFIGAIPSLLLVVIQSPWHALYLLIFIIVLQQVDGNIIGPKILGESTGLSSFWVMFSILIGGGLFGFAGMLLGVPTFALLYYLIRRGVNRTARNKNLPEDTLQYVHAYAVDEESHELLVKEEVPEPPKKEKEPKKTADSKTEEEK